MTESLRTQLVSLLTTAGVNVRLSEDETEEYPFATYEMTVTPVMNKDGVCKYVGETYIRVISDDFDEADALRAVVESAVQTGMGFGQVFSSRLINSNKDCVNGVWTLELYYSLAQYGDAPDVEEADGPDGPAEEDFPAVPEDPENPGQNIEEPADEPLNE
jgi:hypothetical protein